MITDTLKALFTRDLTKLKTEVQAYNNEANMWLVEKDISNTAGNLCLHLIGNLNWFVGAPYANTGYVRHRELEFSTKNTPRAELLAEIDNTLAVVLTALDNITEDQLASEYPHRVFKEPMTTEHFLMHLSTHLAYHLGQINYHRRLLDNR